MAFQLLLGGDSDTEELMVMMTSVPVANIRRGAVAVAETA
jgi:hypothetical protein